MTAPEWMTSATAKASPDARAERIRAKGEQDRLDRAAELELAKGRLTLERQRHAAEMAAKQERRHARTVARTKRAAAVNKAIPTIGRRIMIGGPIVSPMTVAWIGQILFAVHVLGWPIWAAVIFAASWELTTAFAGWMHHQARQDGDRGTLFRVATWLFAASAGAMNYWHALDGNSVTHPTPKAVSYGAMSLVGIGLWELYSSLIHRKSLRARKLMPAARPRFGFARWVRYPRVTWTAWSLSIHDQISTVEEAWSAAVTQIRQRKIRPNDVRNIELAADLSPDTTPVGDSTPGLSGDKSTPPTGDSERQDGASTGDNNEGEAGDNSASGLAPERRQNRTRTSANKTANSRRSMDEWVELAGPIFHAEFDRLQRQPTGYEFAAAIKKAKLGTPSASTAKNIRTEILDRAPLPSMD